MVSRKCFYFGKNPPPIATDGRFSGRSHGVLIAHLPDAYKKDSITKYLEDGDVVELDLLNNKIDLKISNNELLKRKGKYQKLVGDIENGFYTY